MQEATMSVPACCDILSSIHISFQVIYNVREEDLPHLLLTLEGTGFLSLVHCSKQVMVSASNEGTFL